MNTLAIILLQAAKGTGQGSPSMMTSLLPLLLVFVIFYFFMIRPQMKRQKEMNNFRSAISKGDKVVTTGGIYGKVVEVSDTTVVVEIANDVKVKVDKSAVLRDPADTPQK
jgi:preprotein translocase subunit YajC